MERNKNRKNERKRTQSTYSNRHISYHIMISSFTQRTDEENNKLKEKLNICTIKNQSIIFEKQL